MSNHIQAYQGTLAGQPAILTNARDLHAFLGLKSQFGNWISSRIKQYGFTERADYEVVNGKIKNPVGGRPVVDYRLSLDMAKELAMVERTERGREARRYFIECERELLAKVGAGATAPALPAPEPVTRAAFERLLGQTVLLTGAEYLAMKLEAERPRTHARPQPFSETEKRDMLRLAAEGVPAGTIAREVGRHLSSVRGFLKAQAGSAS